MWQEITKEKRAAYVEVLEILNFMEDKYVKKIPEEVLEFFERNKLEDYVFKYDLTKELEEQNLNSNTLAILAMLNLNYWCEDEAKRQELKELYMDNQKKYDELLKVDFDPNRIFNTIKKTEFEEPEQTQIAVMENKEPFLKRILDKIKKVLKIK